MSIPPTRHSQDFLSHLPDSFEVVQALHVVATQTNDRLDEIGRCLPFWPSAEVPDKATFDPLMKNFRLNEVERKELLLKEEAARLAIEAFNRSVKTEDGSRAPIKTGQVLEKLYKQFQNGMLNVDSIDQSFEDPQSIDVREVRMGIGIRAMFAKRQAELIGSICTKLSQAQKKTLEN